VAHEHPTTGTEVGSCRLAFAEVPAVVSVASDIVQGLPSRAWPLLTTDRQPREGVSRLMGAMVSQ
jgi:hypothetical protein